MIALNWRSHPLWLSAEENVCFFSLYSVRVDGDLPKGPSSDRFSEKHRRSRPLMEAEEKRRRWAASDWISCGFGVLKPFYLRLNYLPCCTEKLHYDLKEIVKGVLCTLNNQLPIRPFHHYRQRSHSIIKHWINEVLKFYYLSCASWDTQMRP